VTLFATGPKLAIVHVIRAVAADAGTADNRCIFSPRSGFLVTAVTGNLAVRTIQSISRPAIVIKVPNGPCTGVVAGFAAHSESLFVFVFILVARETVLWCILVTSCFMAPLTRGRDVPPREGKTRQRMVKLRGLPGFVAVALLALGALLALVLVVFFVAAQTIQRGLPEAAHIFMTCNAFDFRLRMSVSQLEFGSIMVKTTTCSLPVAFNMAICTFFAQVTHMLVVFLVAAEAILGRLFEHGTLVAILAFDFCVFAQQGKGGGIMVKLRRLFPIAFRVAAAAILTQ
jgi:hypothetical protein